MKKHFNPDSETVKIVLQGLKENKGYCPCIYQSQGKLEYKCPCKDFRENTVINKLCHCGLYVKDEN